MNAVEETNYYFRKAARIMDVGEPIETLLATPLREVKVQVSIEMDSGEIRTFTGYRIQHDNSRGPMKGGLRYHPQAGPGRVRLARLADDVEDGGGEPALRRRQGRHHVRSQRSSASRSWSGSRASSWTRCRTSSAPPGTSPRRTSTPTPR